MCAFAPFSAPSHVRSIAATSSAPSRQEITATRIVGFRFETRALGFVSSVFVDVFAERDDAFGCREPSSETRSEISSRFFARVFARRVRSEEDDDDASPSPRGARCFFVVSDAFDEAFDDVFAVVERRASPSASASASPSAAAPWRCVLSPRPADASEGKAASSLWNCVWKKSSASVPNRARTETAPFVRSDGTTSAQRSTKSAAAQGASRPTAVTCHRDLGFFAAEASGVTPTSLARGSGASAPPALGNSARVSPLDIVTAAVTSKGFDDGYGCCAGTICLGVWRIMSGVTPYSGVTLSDAKTLPTIWPYDSGRASGEPFS